MRMRKKKHGEERLAACAQYLREKPEAPITSTVDDFGREAELHLEIGSGKGGFACGMAAAHPEACFYAMERVANVMVLAVEKAAASADERTDNLRFMIASADDLEEWFAPSSVDVIYLNFSDPWPKKGYAKRRLTYRGRIETYLRLLKPGGWLRFKTDNTALFAYTLEELEALGLACAYCTDDLHNSPQNEGNIRTEYEENFSAQGIPIHALGIKKA